MPNDGVLTKHNPLQNDSGRLQNITVPGLGPEMTWAVCLHCSRIPGTKRNKATDETLIHMSPFLTHYKGLHGRIFCFSFEKNYFVSENVCVGVSYMVMCDFLGISALRISFMHIHLSSPALFFSRFFFCFHKLTHIHCLLILGGIVLL